jgi:hypothetical protein
MKPNYRARSIFSILALTALIIMLASVPSFSKTVEVEGSRFNLKISMEENLKAFQGLQVSVILTSGQELSGKIKAVGNGSLHLEALKGREYYDAFIRTRDITAVIAKLRIFK